MDITERIISQALARQPGTAALRILSARRKKHERQLDKRAELLAQPDLLEKRTSAHAQAFSLSTEKLKTRKFQTKTEAIEARAEGTPMEGFASDLLNAYTAALEDPKLLKLSNRQLLAEVAKELMKVEPEGPGSSRIEGAHAYKYKADTSLGNLFGVFGEDKDVRKFPGYEQYLERRRAEPIDEWRTGPGEAAAIGAGFTGALIMGSRLLGRTAMMAPIPGARIVGGALMAIPEFMAFDAIHNVIAKTDWGRARQGSWKRLGADMLAGGLVVGGGYKAATVAIRKAAEKSILSKGATEMLMKHPTAKRAIEAGEAQRVARVEQARANEAIVRNIDKEDVLNEVANLSGVLEGVKGVKVAEAAEARMARELARPAVPRFPGPGVVPPVTKVPTVKAGKALIDSILEAQGVKPITKKEAGRIFVKDLEELRADMALRKTEKTGQLREAVAEQRRVQELAREQVRREKVIIAREKAEAAGKEFKERVLAPKEAVEKRAVQRTKLRKKRKIEESVTAVFPGKVMTREEVLAGLREKGIGVKTRAEITAAAKKKKPIATFLGYQENVPGKPAIALYNIEGGRLHKSTVTRTTLEKEKIKVPETPGVKSAKELVDEEFAMAERQIEEDSRRFISLEEAGLEETIYGKKVGAEEAYTEAVKRGGKDLVELMKNGEKIYGFIPALFGSIALADLFSPDTAEASVLAKAAVTVPRLVAQTAKAVKEATTKEGMARIAKDWSDGRLLHIPAVGKEKNTYQEALSLASSAAERHGNLVQNVKSKAIPMSFIKHGSPYWSGEGLYKINPVVEIGSRQSCIGNNAGDSMFVVGRILADVPEVTKGGAKVTKNIMDAMEPVAKRFSADVPAHRAVEWELKELSGVYDRLYKAVSREQGVSLKKAERRIIAELFGEKEIKGRIKGVRYEKALEEIEKKMASLKVAEEELRPAVIAFEKEWLATVEPLAKKHATTRIALACEDTADYSKFPFLKEIMTPEEKEAVIWLKSLHENYGVRLAESGHDIISGPYVHHIWHPAWVEDAAAKKLEEFGLHSRGVPYSKFYHRTKYSKQMIPDISHIMPKYLMDAERRIQWSGFWGIGKKDSWYAHRSWINKFGTDQQKTFWRMITDSTIPPSPTKFNTLANVYTSFEVGRLLAFSGSVPLKHYFKLMGTISSLGFKNFKSTYFESMAVALRSARSVPEVLSIAKKAGITIPETTKGKKKLANEICNSFITQIHRMNTIADLDFEAVIPHKMGFWQTLTKKMQTFNRWGSIGIRAIESVDRHHSVLAGWEMAAKRGMTAKDALYGIYSNIFRNNFLSGAGNPAWMRNPKIRALLLFQNTVFKIMERRLWTGLRAGKDVKTAIGVIRHQDIGETLKQMGEITKYVLGAEKEMKQNLIFDALTATKDFMGTPALKQAMTEMILSGAILGGGGIAGLNLMPQVWHLPLLRVGAKAPTLAVNPFVNAAFRTMGEREEAVDYDVEQDFLVTQFLKNWMRSTAYIPQTANKVLRITKNDIPDIYKGSKWQYFFSIPVYGEGH